MRSLLLIGAALLAACGSDEAQVVVEVRTDLVAGVEFREIDIALIPAGGGGERTTSVTAELGEDYLGGRQVAEFGGEIPTGPTLVRVRLRSLAGGLVAERMVRFTFEQVSVGLSIVITRDCIGVVCPAPGGDRMATECRGMQCVSPNCIDGDEPDCPAAACTSNADCTSSVTCVRGVCVTGVCLYGVVPDACPEGEYCAPDVGCLPVPMIADGGPGVDGGPCVAGAPCTIGCETGTLDCEDSRTCIVTGPAPAGTVCREAISSCDVEEACDGTATVCPSDAFVPAGTDCEAGSCDGLGNCAAGCTPGNPCGTGNPCETGEIECTGGEPTCVASGAAPAGTICRAAIGPCDAEETCSGMTCPADGHAPASTTCRPSASTCDVAERCTGTTPACPIDGFEAAGTACPAGSCDGLGTCSSGCTPGTPCGTGNPCQVDAKICPSGSCMTTGAVPAGTVCRPASGPCDVAETCSGSTCPGDGFAPSTTVCRASADTCDRAERCGGGPGCPGDDVESAGTSCRGSMGPCDPQQTSDGLGTACPSDARHASGFVCRAVAGPCDSAEACDGSSTGCPSDAFIGPPVVCRASTDVCDPQEACSGADASCPSDARSPNGTPCGDGCGCNGDEICRFGVCEIGPPNTGSPCGFSGELCFNGGCYSCMCIVPDCGEAGFPGCLAGGCVPCPESPCYF